MRSLTQHSINHDPLDSQNLTGSTTDQGTNMMMQRNGGRRQPSASGKTGKPSSSQRPENMEQKTAHDREKETAENPAPKPGSSKGRVE